LTLASLPVQDLEVAEDAGLESVLLRDCPELADISALEGKGDLEVLTVRNCGPIGDFNGILELPSLREFVLSETNFGAFDSLAAATQLGTLTLRGTSITDLSPLAAMPELRMLDLSWSEDLRNLAPLEDLMGLRSLTLIGCNGITSVDPLAELQELRSLDLELCSGVNNLEPLASLPRLEFVDARGCGPNIDPEPLRARGVAVFTGQPLSSASRR
jgi:Leucine-rich repeat (LRR) protein